MNLTSEKQRSMCADDKCCGGRFNLGHEGPVNNPDDNMFTEKESEISAEEQFQACLPEKKILKSFVTAEKKYERKTSFDKVLDARIVKIHEILSSKIGVSTIESDQFHTFKSAAQIGNCTPEKALYGTMLKYMASVKDLVDYTAYAPKWITRKSVDLMIGENINLLILLEGLFFERVDENEHKTITAGLE